LVLYQWRLVFQRDCPGRATEKRSHSDKHEA
jgi:hypothetical protein